MIAQQMANAALAPAPSRPQGARPAQPGAAQPGAGQGGISKAVAVKIMMAAMKVIYSNPQGFVNMIRSAPDLTQGIVQATDIILKKIAQSVKGVPPETIKRMYPVVGKQLGPMIGKLLFELASAAGLFKNAPQGAPASGPGARPAAAPAAAPPAGV